MILIHVVLKVVIDRDEHGQVRRSPMESYPRNGHVHPRVEGGENEDPTMYVRSRRKCPFGFNFAPFIWLGDPTYTAHFRA